jgi:hypothetical protein
MNMWNRNGRMSLISSSTNIFHVKYIPFGVLMTTEINVTMTAHWDIFSLRSISSWDLTMDSDREFMRRI